MGDLADVLGRKAVPVKIGDVTLTLRPLSLNQFVELEQATDLSADAYFLRQVYLSAKRGGYEGTEEQLGDLVDGYNLPTVMAAMDELHPKRQAASAEDPTPAAEG